MLYHEIETAETRRFDAQLAGEAFDVASRITSRADYERNGAEYMRRSVNAPVTAEDPAIRAVLDVADRWGAKVHFDLNHETIYRWDAMHVGPVEAGRERAWRERNGGHLELASTDPETRDIICTPLAQLGTAGRAARVVSHELIHTTMNPTERVRSLSVPARVVEEMTAESGAVILANALGFDPVRAEAVDYIGGFCWQAPEPVRVAALEGAVRLARIAASLLLGAVAQADARDMTREVRLDLAHALKTAIMT